MNIVAETTIDFHACARNPLHFSLNVKCDTPTYVDCSLRISQMTPAVTVDALRLINSNHHMQQSIR